MSSSLDSVKKVEFQHALDVVEDIARLLNVGLDRETLGLCVALIEQGAHPEAVASIVRELEAESTSQTGAPV